MGLRRSGGVWILMVLRFGFWFLHIAWCIFVVDVWNICYKYALFDYHVLTSQFFPWTSKRKYERNWHNSQENTSLPGTGRFRNILTISIDWNRTELAKPTGTGNRHRPRMMACEPYKWKMSQEVVGAQETPARPSQEVLAIRDLYKTSVVKMPLKDL